MRSSPTAPGPRVLVAFASRHGGTREIAAAIARTLAAAPGARAPWSVTLPPVDRRPDPRGFDAVVLGSALYEGRWLEPAGAYALEAAPQLQSRPSWLFSSGLPAAPHPAGEDAAGGLTQRVGARGHRLLPGRLERRLLSASERQAWATASTVAGDHRDWRAVRTWSEQIAEDLQQSLSLAAAG